MMRYQKVVVVIVVTIVSISQMLASSPSAPISLQISTDSNTYKVGSEVRVNIRVTNETQEPITIAWGTSAEIYLVDIRDAYGNSVAEKRRAHMRTLGPHTLNPGESTEDQLFLNRIYDLSHPGAYTFQLRRNPKYEPEAKTQNVRSNVLTVKITE